MQKKEHPKNELEPSALNLLVSSGLFVFLILIVYININDWSLNLFVIVIDTPSELKEKEASKKAKDDKVVEENGTLCSVSMFNFNFNRLH